MNGQNEKKDYSKKEVSIEENYEQEINGSKQTR